MTRLPFLATLLLTACGGGSGTWQTELYGEPYIEEGIPAAEFEDACSTRFSTFNVVVTEAALVDGDGGDTTEPIEATMFDVVAVGPHSAFALEGAAQHYDNARFVIAAASGTPAVGNSDEATAATMAGKSVHAAGELTCGGITKTFDWSFDKSTTYICEPEDLTLPANGESRTQLTIHGDHLFYDGLENEDAVVRGQAIFDADANDDGVITQAELRAVPVAPLGYQVGQFSEVTELDAFVAHLTQTLGHVDGEGHCNVIY